MSFLRSSVIPAEAGIQFQPRVLMRGWSPAKPGRVHGTGICYNSKQGLLNNLFFKSRYLRRPIAAVFQAAICTPQCRFRPLVAYACGEILHILQKQSKKYNKVERILSRFITINEIVITASEVLASLARGIKGVKSLFLVEYQGILFFSLKLANSHLILLHDLFRYLSCLKKPDKNSFAKRNLLVRM